MLVYRGVSIGEPLMLFLTNSRLVRYIYNLMDPTIGERIAGQIHLFCFKQLIRQGKYTDNPDLLYPRMYSCFSSFSEQQRYVV